PPSLPVFSMMVTSNPATDAASAAVSAAAPEPITSKSLEALQSPVGLIGALSSAAGQLTCSVPFGPMIWASDGCQDSQTLSPGSAVRARRLFISLTTISSPESARARYLVVPPKYNASSTIAEMWFHPWMD